MCGGVRKHLRTCASPSSPPATSGLRILTGEETSLELQDQVIPCGLIPAPAPIVACNREPVMFAAVGLAASLAMTSANALASIPNGIAVNSQAQQNQPDAFSRGIDAYNQSDFEEAVRWFLLAADQGSARAQFNLAVMYRTGRGVPQDPVEAARLYRLAANQGHMGAQNSLGITYDNGEGVARDVC
jgi:hypothetical protein